MIITAIPNRRLRVEIESDGNENLIFDESFDMIVNVEYVNGKVHILSTLDIYNLTDETANKIYAGKKIVISAGLYNELIVIYSGIIRFADFVVAETVDRPFKIQMIAIPEEYEKLVISLSYRIPVFYINILEDFKSKINIPFFIPNEFYSIGEKTRFSFIGNYWVGLKELLKPIDYTASLINGKVVLSSVKNKSTSVARIPLISKNTGLINVVSYEFSPYTKLFMVNFNVLFNADLLLYNVVKVQSKNIDSLISILKINIVLTSNDSDFTMQIRGFKIDTI